MTFWRYAAAALAVGLSGAASAQTGGEAEANALVVYRDITLIDGAGGAPRAHVSIVTEGPAIRAILAAGEAPPEGARVVEASGLYVVPGLIDAHVHIATPPDAASARATLRRQLYAGVTAVRVMADDLRSVAELARAARLGEIASPDIYFAALMAGDSFFEDPRTRAATGGETPGHVPWMQAINDRTVLRLAVAQARGTHASGIKIYANLPARLVRNVTREAHRQGIPVWAHTAVYPASPADVAAAGVDVMSHACSLAHQAQAQMPQTYASRLPMEDGDLVGGANPAVARVVSEMARRGIILDATVRIYAEQHDAHVADPTRRRGLCSPALSYAMARQAFRAGVRIAAGTDGETEWQDPFPSLIEELELLQDVVGMSPLEVIQAATQHGAAAMGREDMGVIAPGRLANMVFTREDPSADVSNLRSVQFVVRRGVVFERSGYTPITAGEVGEEN
jgi:imidazolonepropionase-like amidohydrolase